MNVKSISVNKVFYYYSSNAYAFYNYAVVQLQLSSSDAQLLQGKNIVSVELNGRTSDVEWTFPTSGSSLAKNYLTVESTSSTFKSMRTKIRTDYLIADSMYVNAVVYYTD